MKSILTDTHNRFHDYLRISLTDNCNLRCFYCMPEEDYEFTPASRLMQADEITALASLFVSHGVKKIRLTGGEPLVRKDAATIIRNLSQLPVELTLTTNGTRLHEFVSLFSDCGIRSLNISLDTLQPERFNFLTRRNQFDLVYKNIRLLLDKGFNVKLNMVVIKGLNDDELIDFVAWTKDQPIHVRFIEFMPFAGNRWTSNKVVTWQDILHRVGQEYSILPIQGAPQDTAKKYLVPGHQGTFAVISTMSNNFCSTCNRIRLTADGKLKNCLFSTSETDLLTPFREGKNIESLVAQSIQSKARELGGQMSNDFEQIQAGSLTNRSMITIGG